MIVQDHSIGYSRFGMPLGGKVARELILTELSSGLPLKRSEIARRIGEVHHANGGRPMDKSKLIGVAKKELKMMLEDGLVTQPASGWYRISIGGETLESYTELSESDPILSLPKTSSMGQINEAQTQRSVIEPVLSSVLGWDISDHTRVHVEKALDAEISTNFVDYALDHDADGKYEILIEAKRLDSALTGTEADQLLRYMRMSQAKLGILTNGSSWLFFDRQSEPDSPILDFDLEELAVDRELQNVFYLLSYDSWNLTKFIAWSRTNSHKRAVAGIIESEIFGSPSDELLEFLIRKVRPNGAITKRVMTNTRDVFEKIVSDWLTENEDELPSTALDNEENPHS